MLYQIVLWLFFFFCYWQRSVTWNNRAVGWNAPDFGQLCHICSNVFLPSIFAQSKSLETLTIKEVLCHHLFTLWHCISTFWSLQGRLLYTGHVNEVLHSWRQRSFIVPPPPSLGYATTISFNYHPHSRRLAAHRRPSWRSTGFLLIGFRLFRWCAANKHPTVSSSMVFFNVLQWVKFTVTVVQQWIRIGMPPTAGHQRSKISRSDFDIWESVEVGIPYTRVLCSVQKKKRPVF